MDIRSDEITKILKQQIGDYESEVDVAEVGTIEVEIASIDTGVPPVRR